LLTAPTRFKPYGNKNGFGHTTYETDAKDEWNRVTVSLARFAEYSNIGENRTGEFGEVYLIPR
jgi:hypothetical protein